MAGSNVPIDVPLTNISVAAYQDGEGFIADKVFPQVPVDEQSGLYYVWDETELNRDTAERRADATESAGDSYDLKDDRYFADVWALHRDVGDQLQKNHARNPLQPFAGAARFLVNKMRIREEVDFFRKFGQEGVWGHDVQGIATGSPTDDTFLQFSNDASDPVAVVEDLKNRISDGTGLEANVLAIGKKVWSVLKNHPAIIERFKYTSADNVSLQILANLLEVDRVLVAKAIVNQAKAGKGIDNVRLFDKSMLLVHAAATPGIETPTAGYTFSWTGISEGLGESIGTTQFRMEHLKADRVESQIAFDHKVVAKSLGLLARDVVA
jgi:hypothetical protein